MGHMHKGRQFAKPHIHASFANSLVLMVLVQVGIGAGLKLHLEERKGWLGRIFGSSTGRGGRRIIVIAHSWIGKLMPVVAWTQMLFGGIVALGFCRGDHLGQCLAHFIMGSAFIGYGIVMTIMLMVGQAWLRRTGRSQEFFDSIVIAAWGCVNTFTEHRWGQAWVKNDLQHTSMGIVWWCAGLLGIWLSRSRTGRPRRNILPGIVILLTGWAMSAHPQELPLSTMVHSVFGYTLMAAGATRIIEICFLLKDSRGNTEPSSWQHLPPFVSLTLRTWPPPSFTDTCLATLRLRPPLPLRHRTTNVPPLRPLRHTRLLHPHPLLRRLPDVPLRADPATYLCAVYVAGG